MKVGFNVVISNWKIFATNPYNWKTYIQCTVSSREVERKFWFILHISSLKWNKYCRLWIDLGKNTVYSIPEICFWRIRNTILIYHTWYERDFRNNTEISAMVTTTTTTQAPTNHPFCRLLVYQCLRTKKKITHFKFKHQYPIVYSAEVERSSLSLFPPSHPNESFFSLKFVIHLYAACRSMRFPVLTKSYTQKVPLFRNPQDLSFPMQWCPPRGPGYGIVFENFE